MPKAFVYGAQMAHPESLGAAWPARVDEHAVRFVARGLPIFEPAFAGLEPAVGEQAYGVIVDFSDAAWAELLAHERGYEVVDVEAILLDEADVAELGAARLCCPAFRLLPRSRRRHEGRPSARYARRLAIGARAHGLPPQIIARYEQAAAVGGRASLALAWLFPVASRLGLVPTAILLLLLLLALVLGPFLLAG